MITNTQTRGTYQFTEYEKKGYVVDAKLAHLAAGFELSQKLAKGQVE